MEGAIGGSALDDLRHIMGLDELNDGDIIFKLVPLPGIDLTEYLSPTYQIPKGYTFVAYCNKHETNEFIAMLDSEEEYFEWLPFQEQTDETH